MRQEAIVLLVLATGLAAANPVDNKLGELCRGAKVSLKTVDELDDLVARANSSESTGCPPLVVAALREMKEIADDKKACTMRKAKAITGFVDKYLRNPSEKIPKALADFAVAYGMQVSGICSRDMVDGFSKEVDARVYDKVGAAAYDDYTDFKRYLLDKSPVGMVLEPITKSGEVILPADLVQAIPDIEIKLKLELSNESAYNNLRKVCGNIFRPLYESALLPLAHLIQAGFVNRAKLRGRQFKDNGRFWATVVFLCESLELYEIEVRNTPEQVAAESEISFAVGSLDGKELNSDLPDGVVESTSIGSSEREVEVGDDIVSPSVKSLVKGYNANKDAVERLRELIAARSLRMLRVLSKNGQYRPMLESMFSMVKLKDQAKAAEFERAKQSLMRFIENPEREKKALERQVRERNNGMMPKGYNELEMKKRRFWRGLLGFGKNFGLAILISIIVLYKFVGAFVIVAYTLIGLVPGFLLVLLLSPCGSRRKDSRVNNFLKGIDKAVLNLCGWPNGLFKW